MKNASFFKSLLATAGFAGLLITAMAPGAIAQQESPEQKTRKVRLKIFTEVDGKQTVKDTIMEISGELPLPDLRNLKSKQVYVSGTGDKELEQLLFKRLPDTKNSISSGEANTFIYRTPDGDPQNLRKATIEKRIYKVHKAEDGETKIYHDIFPEGPFRTDSARPARVFRFRSGDQNGIETEIRKLPTGQEMLRELNMEEIRKMLPLHSDSLTTFRRIIIVDCDAAGLVKKLSEEKPLPELSGSKIQNLNLDRAELYPNPNSGTFNLAFEVAKKTNTSIIITDALGKEVYREDLKNFKGHYQKEIDLRHLSKGMYYVQVNQGKHIYNKKLVLQ